MTSEKLTELAAEITELRSRLTASQKLGLLAIYMADTLGDDELVEEKARYDRRLKAEARLTALAEVRSLIGHKGFEVYEQIVARAREDAAE
jgi:hypothetical protein